MLLLIFFFNLSGRLFKKIELSESIRYASRDPIESWLNKLLCLDVSNAIPNLSRLYQAYSIFTWKMRPFFSIFIYSSFVLKSGYPQPVSVIYTMLIGILSSPITGIVNYFCR